MRILGALIFLMGAVISFVPSVEFGGYSFFREFKRATVYSSGESKPFEIEIDELRGTLAVSVEIEEGGIYKPGSQGAVLTIVAQNNGNTIWTNAISFAEGYRPVSLEGAIKLYTSSPTPIFNARPGLYKFTVNQGDVDEINLFKVDLVLARNPLANLPYASSYGTILIWLGAAVFVFGLRRRNRVDPAAPPAPSKWGRGP